MPNFKFSGVCKLCNNTPVTLVMGLEYATTVHLLSADDAHTGLVYSPDFMRKLRAKTVGVGEVVSVSLGCRAFLREMEIMTRFTVTEIIPSRSPMLNEITLGCDPEFAAYLGNNRVNFKEILARNGELGWDHNGEVGELRPPPAKFARTLLRRMRNIMRAAPEQLRSATWRSGAIAKTLPERPPEDRSAFSFLGGHVHLGVDFRLCSLPLITRGLDAFTNSLFKLDILPEEENKIRQRSYGRPGDVRQDFKGGQPVIEYRTMCSWLFDPRVALMALEGARLTTAEPEFAIGKLATPSHTNLHTFFTAFKQRSKDAAYIVEVVLPKLGKLQFDQDVQDAWELDAPKVTQIGL